MARWITICTGLTAAFLNVQTALSQPRPDEPEGLAIYGQINRGILNYDDGPSNNAYWFVDNSKSVSRIGATYQTPLNDDWRFHARGELALRWKETNVVNRLDPHDSGYKFDRTELRKLEFTLAHDRYGKFTFGQGAMSADGITGLDFSLTTVVAGTPVQDVAGGQLLVPVGTSTPGNLQIKQAFRSMGSSRRLRLRYDAPIIKGVRFIVAGGQEILSDTNNRKYADTSLRYDGDHGDFRVRVGGAYRWIEDSKNVFIASGSVLHRPTRLNVTLATGHEQGGARYNYIKLGYIARWFDLGQTAFSIDVYDGDSIAVAGGKSRSYGLAMVQKVKSPKMDLYALLRRYEYNEPSQDYQDALALLVGVRWSF